MSIALGIDEKNAKRNWPPLCNEDLYKVLANFGLIPSTKAISWHSDRPFSSAGIITLSNKQQVFVKRHDYRLRPADTLIDEHHFINHLAAQGLPVCQPLYNQLYNSSISIERDGVFEVFPLLKGQDLYHNTRSWEAYHTARHAEASGEMLAHLHQASHSYHQTTRTPCLLTSAMEPLLHDDLATGLRCWVLSQPGLTAHLPNTWLNDLLPLIIPFHDRFRALRNYIIPLWGHGDWHGSNVTWHNDNICSIFDFGMSNLSCAEFDLAVAIERSFIRWLAPSSRHPVSFEQLERFLQGYNRKSSRAPARYALIAALLPLCHITFALSEIAYYGYLLDDPKTAEFVYHSYLLGHARWFHRPTGQSLLYALAPYA